MSSINVKARAPEDWIAPMEYEDDENDDPEDNEEEEEEEEEEKEGERTIPGAAGLEGVDPGAACWSAAPASPNTTRYLYTRSVLASQTSTAVVRAS